MRGPDKLRTALLTGLFLASCAPVQDIQRFRFKLTETKPSGHYAFTIEHLRRELNSTIALYGDALDELGKYCTDINVTFERRLYGPFIREVQLLAITGNADCKNIPEEWKIRK